MSCRVVLVGIAPDLGLCPVEAQLWPQAVKSIRSKMSRTVALPFVIEWGHQTIERRHDNV